jgi:hypothetical protein
MTWIATITDGADFVSLVNTNGVNTGALQVVVDENSDNVLRTATIEVASPGAADSPQTITITQSTQDAVLEVVPQSQSIGSAGGSVSFLVRNGGEDELVWSVSITDGVEFMTLNTANTGVNEGLITVQVAAYAGTLDRSGRLLVTAHDSSETPQQIELLISQSSRQPELLLMPREQRIGAGGGTAYIALENAGGSTMSWTAYLGEGASLGTIAAPSSGIGNATIAVTVDPNDRQEERVLIVHVETSGDGAEDAATQAVIFQDACRAPAAPLNLAASDGTFTDAVQLIWSPSEGAGSYSVFRAVEDDPTTAQLLGTATTPIFVDDTALYPEVDIVGAGCFDPGQYQVEYYTYYYWVEATNNCSSSELSDSDDGYRTYNIRTPDPLVKSDAAAVLPIDLAKGSHLGNALVFALFLVILTGARLRRRAVVIPSKDA